MEFSYSPVQKMLAKTVTEFCDKEIAPLANYLYENKDLPDDFLAKMGQARMLGLVIPKEYGGVGTTNLNTAMIAEALGKTGTGCFWPFLINNSTAEKIYKFGSEEQRKRFLPPLCDGSAYASTAFTEPGTGSNPRALTTTATPQGDDYIVNGTKRFITMGGKPGYGVFYAKDVSLKGKKADTVALIIDKTSEGYTPSMPWDLMGLDGIHVVDVFLKNVRVPKSRVLGKPGKGFGLLRQWIASERLQHMAVMVGIGQAALDESIQYAKERLAGGKPMGAMQGIQWMLAEMKTKVDACRLMVQRAAFTHDMEEPFDVLSSELKLFVVPMIQEVARMAVQIHGAYGYSKEYKVERLFRIAAHGGVVASSVEVNKTIAGASLVR